MGWHLIGELRQLSNDLVTIDLDKAVKAKHPAILDAAARRIEELDTRAELLNEGLKVAERHVEILAGLVRGLSRFILLNTDRDNRGYDRGIRNAKRAMSYIDQYGLKGCVITTRAMDATEELP